VHGAVSALTRDLQAVRLFASRTDAWSSKYMNKGFAGWLLIGLCNGSMKHGLHLLENLQAESLFGFSACCCTCMKPCHSWLLEHWHPGSLALLVA
jgi:hypothetical protein